MHLDRLAAAIGARLLAVESAPLVEAHDLVHIAGDARPGAVFAAVPGTRTHGATHAAEAAAGGAAAVLTDETGLAMVAEAGLTLPVLVSDDLAEAVGRAAALVHGSPAQGLRVVAVTGTNGKTTTTHIIDAALTAMGRRPGLIGTVTTGAAGARQASSHTTPAAPELHRLLRAMDDEGVTDVAMEASSHALAQGRTAGLVADVAAFTNLTREHLDYHGTMEGYFEAKARLFTPERARAAVICADDKWGRRLVRRALEAGLPTTALVTEGSAGTAGTQGTEAGEPLPAGAQVWRLAGAPGQDELALTGPQGQRLVARTPLPGEHNKTNTALAALCLHALGHPLAEISAALPTTLQLPGRMEQVVLGPGAPRVLIDFAHTPDAFRRSVHSLRLRTQGRLVSTASAGGDRDREKRPEIGRAVVEAGADVVVVTDDNPRSEDPAAIRAAVMAGVRAAAAQTDRPLEVVEASDRRDAMRLGLLAAGPDGTFVLHGKGHEQQMQIGPPGTAVPWVDADEVRAAWADLTGNDQPGKGGWRPGPLPSRM